MKDRPQQEEVASWLATFADLATLLLTFYVLIYASSTYKPGDWETAEGAVRRMLSVLQGNTQTALIAAQGEGALPAHTSALALLQSASGLSERDRQAMQGYLYQMLDEVGDAGDLEDIEVEPLDNGLLFRLAEPLVFSRGEANLTPKSLPYLRVVADVVRIRPARVTVEGYTCDLPVRGGRYRSNWELSGARATEVVRFLESYGIGGAEVSARAMGEFSPRVPNTDARSRQRNRRVEIQVEFESAS